VALLLAEESSWWGYAPLRSGLGTGSGEPWLKHLFPPLSPFPIKTSTALYYSSLGRRFYLGLSISWPNRTESMLERQCNDHADREYPHARHERYGTLPRLAPRADRAACGPSAFSKPHPPITGSQLPPSSILSRNHYCFEATFGRTNALVLACPT
jgi:hypothetical protein